MSLYRDLDTLARTVLEINENVKDYMEAAAILEAVGVSKATANKMGYPDVFALAKDVMNIVEHYRGVGEVEGEERPSRLERITEAIRLFFSGVLLSSPWLVITLSYFLFGVALLPVYEEPLKATAIDFSLTLSIIVTSFLQPMFMRKLLYYIYQEDLENAERITAMYYASGAGVVAASAIILLITLSRIEAYPPWWPLYTVAYFIPFALFWLTMSPLYALRRHLALAMSYVVALAFIGIMYYAFGEAFTPHLIHIYGILLGAFFSAMYLLSLLYIRSKVISGRVSEPTIPPRLSFIAYTGIAYSIVGLLYFLFVFMDRFLVWTLSETYPLLANIEYEKAANLSLLILCAPLGAMNYYLTKLYNEISRGGDRFTLKEVEGYTARVSGYFKRACLMLLLYGALSHLALSLLFFHLKWLPSLRSWLIYTSSGISYTFLPAFFLALLIGIFLYRPGTFLWISGLGTALNFTLGLLCTRLIGFEYASISYATSSIVMVCAAIIITLRILKRADYAYYSAF